MFGFIFGALCLVGLVRVARGYGYSRFGGGCHSHGHRHGRWRGGYGGFEGPRGYGRFDEDSYSDLREDESFEPGPRGGHFEGRGFGDGRGMQGGFGFGPWKMLRRLAAELELTGDQEKELRNLFSNWREARHEVKGAVRSTKSDISKAIRSESFDETQMGESAAAFEQAADAMRKRLIDTVAKIHQVLDAKQRARLADILEQWNPRRGQSAYR